MAHTNFFIGGEDPKMKKIKRAVDFFLRGEYEKINDDE